jgi:hypothetical protein
VGCFTPTSPVAAAARSTACFPVNVAWTHCPPMTSAPPTTIPPSLLLCACDQTQGGRARRPQGVDQSLKTFTGHRVLQTLIRCSFSPAATTGERFVVSGERGRHCTLVLSRLLSLRAPRSCACRSCAPAVCVQVWSGACEESVRCKACLHCWRALGTDPVQPRTWCHARCHTRAPPALARTSFHRLAVHIAERQLTVGVR